MTQEQIAEKAEIRREQWLKYEGGAEPGASVLSRIQAAGVDVLYVLSGARSSTHLQMSVLDTQQYASAVVSEPVIHYAAEGKSYLTIAIGCTGGHHRSVSVAEEIGRRLRSAGQPVRISHRDIAR
jgi:hypothetical protein